MRADLQSVTGDGLNLSFSVDGNFSVLGSGNVIIDLAQGSATPAVTGATIASFGGGKIELSLNGTGIQDVTLTMVSSEFVIGLALSADAGLSSTDFITNVAAQTITGTLSAPLAAGDQVQVSLDDGLTWQTATAATGATTFSLSGATLTGSNTLVAEVVNTASLASAALAQPYVLDTTPPPAPTNLALAPGSDSGLSATDDITNVTTPSFNGTGEAAGLVTLYDGATVLGTGTVTAGGTWSVTDSVTLPNGVHSITATEEDVAGNVGPASVPVSVTIDTVPPVTPTNLALAPGSDSGLSGTDDITNVTTPTLTGTGEPGALVTLYDGLIALGTGTVTAAGTWSVTDGMTLADGVHNITATAEDAAGNVGPASVPLSVTIDTVPPVAPTKPALAPGSDNGVSSTDNVTGVTTPTFIGTGEAGGLVTVYDGTTVLGTATAAVGGTWSMTDGVILVDGVHSITATEEDVAGNLSPASVPLSVTIETVALAPTNLALAAASDSGLSSTDAITKVTKPTFIGSSEAGSLVTVYDGATVLGTGTVTAGGTWSVTDTVTLSNGVHSITATQKDLVGNISPASVPLSVTIDTVAPVAPTNLALAPGSDSGLSSTDNITNINKPTINGTGEAGGLITLYNGATVLGTGTVSAGGTWSVTATVALANGARNITARETDLAGNVGPASVALAVTIDTTVPPAPSRPALAAGSDSGLSSTDKITNVTTPTFTGTGQAGDLLTLYDGTTVLGTATVTAAGAWSVADSLILANGVHSITAKQEDLAGNIGVASTALAVTVDTVPPLAPTLTLAPASDSGSSNSDRITNVTTPTFKGTGDARGLVTVYDGTTVSERPLSGVPGTGPWPTP